MNRGRRRLGRLALAGLAIAIVAGCGTAAHPAAAPSSSAAAAGAATIGALTISGGYIPQPASPDVAAAYLTITNAGAAPDAITTIRTDVTDSVMAMTETVDQGVGTMTGLHSVTVPAHGQVSFTPGHAHLMLAKPTPRLRPGQHVRLTITFRHAGTVVLMLPVVPLTQTPPTPSMSMTPSMSPSMTPSMSMSR